MPVYVLHQNNMPLMPTSPAKSRHLLRAGKAVVIQQEPFTIQLVVPSGQRVQEVNCGVDLGAKEVGIAAVSHGQVLYQGEVELRTDIHKRMETRAMYRRTRRGKNLRYRAPRFNNRAASRRKGRLPPSVQSRVDTVVKVVRRLAEVLPIHYLYVETANFDTHAMSKGRLLQNWEYQHGELYRQENIKAYVRTRDKHTCQYCGEVSPVKMEVDHIIPRSRGGSDVPGNLVASCHECNQKKGKQTAAEFGYPELQAKVKAKRLSMAAITQMGKTATLQRLAEIAPVTETFGYITKVDRKAIELPKTHYYDAVAIACAGEPVKALPTYERVRAVSRGARQQRKGSHSQMVARMPYEVFGYRLWDKVRLANGTVAFVGARRKTGIFTIKDIFGKEFTSQTYKKLMLVARARTLLARQLSVLENCDDAS